METYQYDSGIRCWGVCLTSCILQAVSVGMTNCFGVILLDLQESYDVTLAEISFVGSAAAGIRIVMGPLVALALNKIGFRLTAIFGAVITAASMAACLTTDNFIIFQFCYGFMMGTGLAFLYMPASTCSTFYFKEQQALAFGIACAGAMLGYAVFPAAHSLIFVNFQKEGIFVFNGILSFCLLPLVYLFFPMPREVQLRSQEMSKSPGPSDRRRSSISMVSVAVGPSSTLKEQLEIMREPIFWCFSAANICIGAGHITSSLFIPKIAHANLGVSKHLGGMLMTIIGLSGILSRVFVGWLVDLEPVEPLCAYSAGLLGSMACCALYPFVPNYWAMALTVALHAFFMALYSTPFTICCLEVCGISRVNFGAAMMLFFIGVGAIAWPPLTGYILELGGQDFVVAMAVVILVYGLASFWMGITVKLHNARKVE